MEFEAGKRIRMHLDIAPLVDIVFLLLIFFMLTANFIMQPGIKIKLPEAKTARPREKEEIIVFVTEDNRIYLNERELTVGDLKGALENRIEKAKKRTVILKADEKINLGLAVKVMDIAKDAGAETLAISTAITESLHKDYTDPVPGTSRADR
ncbi:MAG: biopolymer transporter ExbD [Candidatus Omnitrophota bacterium]|nr:biopolymer transporter ExbD [Candidatus Omnitrophota bacterium]